MENFFSRLRCQVRAFRKAAQGTAALEFAMIAPIYFALIFSCFEAGFMYTKISIVEGAMNDVTRKIYTGQVKGKMTRNDLISIFCGEVSNVMSCSENNVTLEVRRMSKASDFTNDSAICVHGDEEGEGKELPTYSDTTGGDIVYVRFCVTTELLVPSLRNLTFAGINVGLQLHESGPGRYSIVSSSVFRNEPFSS